MDSKNRLRIRIIIAAVVFVLVIILAVYLIVNMIRSNENSKIKRVIGIDVSSYQGNIDWKQIEDQEIYFAYIKATEGKDYLDKKFKQNWENINDTDIRKGAYMFFNFNQDGREMADFFIKNVPVERNTLPPAIDFEYEEKDRKSLPDKKIVVENLNKVIDKFKENYNQTPVLYTNSSSYSAYLEEANLNDKVQLWISNISVSDPNTVNKNWKFWQFSWRGMLNGIELNQSFVDMDLYNGNLNDFYNEYDSKLF